MSEAKLWGKLKRVLQAHGGIRFCRHEDSVTGGIPDVSYGTDRVNGWIELKYAKHPKNPDTAPLGGKIRPAQVRFLESRVCTYILVELARKDGSVYFLFSGKIAQQLDYLPISMWEGACVLFTRELSAEMLLYHIG